MRTLLIGLSLLFVLAITPRFAFAQEPAAPAPAPTGQTRTPAELRQICADAMNQNPMFAESIVKTINEDTALQHARAASAIAKNEKHVILAYGAMWVVAAGFVVFLWRRQQKLQIEIAHLRRDLEAAAK